MSNQEKPCGAEVPSGRQPDECKKKEEETRLQRLKDRLVGLDPTTVPDELLHLMRAVANVDDPVMSCEECQAWLPSYVDAEVGGLAVGQLYPKVKRHIDLCSNCETEYLEMLKLALVEDAGELLMPETFPIPDLSFLPLPSFVEMAREMVTKVAESALTILAPDMVEDLAIVDEIFFARVEELGGRFSLRRAPSTALSLGVGETSTALLFLAASYETTRRIAETFSTQEIQAQANQENLADTLAQIAEKVARDTMIGRREAQGFAQIYAEGVQDEINTWLSLIERLRQGE